MSTGLRAGTNNDGYLQVNGTDVLTALSSGNIGIGTDNPQAKLDAMSTGNFTVDGDTFDGVSLILRNAGGTQGNGNYGSAIAFTQIGNAGVPGYRAAITSVQTGGDSDQLGLAFLTHPSVTGGDDLLEALRITSTGNVGIGTTSPAALLHLDQGGVSSSTQGPEIRLSRKSLSGASLTAGDILNTVKFQTNEPSRYYSLEQRSGNATTNSTFHLAFEDDNAKHTRLTVNAAGNVGIGTTNPATKLQVYGQLTAKQQIYLNDASDARILRVTEIASRDVRFDTYNDTDFNGTLRFGGQTLIVESGTGGGISESLRINSSGNIGIGSTDPDEKLHIQGTGDLKIKLQTTSTGVNANVGLMLSTASEGSFIIQTGNAVVSGSGGLRLYDLSNNAERITVYPSGSLKVGTTFTGLNNGTASGTPLWVNSVKNTISMFIGDGQPTNSYGADEYSSDIRFNGSGINWGDISYYPNGESGNGAFRFTRNGNTVGSTGNASIGVSRVIVSNGGGIDFASNPNAGGATSELLDDYEEGTWTPSYQTLNNNMTGFSHNIQFGKYTKIGRMVHVYLNIGTQNAVSLTGTGVVLINGLPFAAADVANAGINVLALTHDNRFVNNPRYGQVQSLTTAIKLFKTDGMNTNNDGLTTSDFTKTNSPNYNLLSIEFSYMIA